MTEKEILALPAGKALDALVAEHLLGWRWMCRRNAAHLYWLLPPDTPAGVEPEKTCPSGPLDYCPSPPAWEDRCAASELPHTSDNLDAAGVLIEALRHRAVFLSLHSWLNVYTCAAWKEGRSGEWELVHDEDCVSETAPLALSRCALLAALRLEVRP